MVTEALVKAIEQQARPGEIYSRDVPMTGSPRFVTFSGLYGDTFDRYTNPDSISFEIYNQMRYYGIIRAALILIKAPILSCLQRATVECDDPKIKRVVEHTFLDSGLLYRLGRTSLRAIEFGIAAHEKVWEVEDLHLTMQVKDDETGDAYEDVAWSGPIETIADFREVNPMTVRYILRDPVKRTFAGFVQSYAPTWLATSGAPEKTAQPTPEQAGLPKGVNPASIDGIPIAAQKAFIYTHDQEFGNLWGVSRLRAAYPTYFWAQVLRKYSMFWAERKIAPTRMVKHPVGRAPDGTDYSDLALDLANKIDDVNAIAIPNTKQPMPGLQPGGGAAEWEFSEVPTTDKAETFKLYKDDLDTDTLRAMFVPERTFTTGQGFGLFSTDAQAHTDTFLMTEDAEAGDFIDAVNADAVLPFVVVNFGSGAPKATITVPGITDAHREMLREIITTILTTPGVPDVIDVRGILEQLGVPLKDVEPAAEAPAPDGDETAPGAEPAGGVPAGATPQPPAAPPGAGAAPVAGSAPPATGAPGGPPANLVLDDAIALDFDSTRWDVSPDPKALNGFKVVDKQTGQRLTGFAAQQVVVAWQKQSAADAKKGASAAKSAGAKAERQAIAQGKRDLAAAQRAQRKAEADARRAASAARVAKAKADRLGTAAAKQAAHAALVSQHKADMAAKQAARETARHEAAAKREAAKQTAAAAKSTRQQAAASKQQASVAAAGLHSQVASVQKERSVLQQTTQQQNPADAIKTLQQNGYKVSTTADANSYDRLVQQARQTAAQDPNSIFTVIKVKGGFALISKPRASVPTAAAAPSNVGLDDTEPVQLAAGGYATGHLPPAIVEAAAERIAGHLRKRGAA